MRNAKMYYLLGIVTFLLIIGFGILFFGADRQPEVGPGSGNQNQTDNQGQNGEDAVPNQGNNDGDSQGAQNNPDRPEGVLPGFAAPDFELKSIEGQSAGLSDYRGKFVLLTFWHFGSNESVAQLEELQELNIKADRTGENVVPLAVNYRNGSAVEAYFKTKKYGFTSLLDEKGEVSEKYKINIFPMSFLIDPDGMIGELWTSKFDSQDILDKIEEIERE